MAVMLLKLPPFLFMSHVSIYLYFFFVAYSLDQERIHSLDSSSLPLKIENVRYPIKPRTMAQAQIPSEESFLDVSLDGDVTIVQKCKQNF
jgi:hypothetical protein